MHGLSQTKLEAKSTRRLTREWIIRRLTSCLSILPISVRQKSACRCFLLR